MNGQPIPATDVIANIKGVAFAAFMPVETIAALLKCQLYEAEAFQARAHSDFTRVMAMARQARAR